MKRFVRLLSALSVPALIGLAGSAGAGAAGASATPIPLRIKTSLLSQGGRGWFEKPSASARPGVAAAMSVAFGSNVDANDPTLDLAAGQSETAIAATGNRVLAAWNDATAFFVQPTTLRTASGTGVGFSADGGHSFTDLVGLPNSDPTHQWAGDPSIVAVGDGIHFIVGSLFVPAGQAFCFSPTDKLVSKLAVSVATVSPTNQVTFTNQIVAARGGNLCDFNDPNNSFLDKDFLSYDATTRTLVMSYTKFFGNFPLHSGNGQVELVRAHVPADPATLSKTDFSQPVVVWPEEGAVVNQGAYPAVAPGGTTFVAWERNIDSNQFNGDPYVYLHVARVQPNGTAADIGGPNLPRVLTTGQVNSNGLGGVRSMDTVVIVGYNRGTGNDFPRLAVDVPLGKVVAVWNDASAHPLGDIWLRALTYNLDISPSTPIRKVNDDNSFALHFLPAVSVRAGGAVAVSWYDRRLNGPDSSRTDYFADIRATPAQNGADVRITTGATDWANTSSLIAPNFGDYTDNASSGEKTYFTWSDGRIGVPQPFVDSR